MRPYLPSMLAGGTNWHNRPDFRGLPGVVLGRIQLRNGVDASSANALTCQGTKWEAMLK